MINFILPQAYNNNYFNQSLNNYIHTFQDHINFNEKVNIMAQEGNFPFSFWHGGINNNIGQKIILQKEAVEFSYKLTIPIILDFSNQYLNIIPNWIKDPHIKMILDVFKNRGNYIKVSNPEIKDEILTYYPGSFFFIFSYVEDNKDIIVNFPEYNFIEDSDLNLCGAKSKIIYPLRTRCNYCSKKFDCFSLEQIAQISFTQDSIRTICENKFPTVKEVLNEYLVMREKGIRYFIFEEIPNNNIFDFNDFLIEFFIKPEYFNHFRKGLSTE